MLSKTKTRILYMVSYGRCTYPGGGIGDGELLGSSGGVGFWVGGWMVGLGVETRTRTPWRREERATDEECDLGLETRGTLAKV